MHDDLKEEVLEVVATSRLNANQAVRQKIVAELTKNIENTATDPKLAGVLLAALKDSDSSDIKRLALNQNERSLDNRAQVLSFLEQISQQVKDNPYYVAEPRVRQQKELPNRPATFYEKDDFLDGELEIETKLTTYNDFMRSRNAIPSEANLVESDSTN